MAKLTGYDKAAVLLMMLGEEAASEILKGLDPRDLRQLGGLIVKTSDVPQETADSVITEFIEQLATGSNMRLEGRDFAHKVLTRVLGRDQAQRVLENLAEPEATGFDALKWLDPKSIAGILAVEHPQTIALILTHLPADEAGKIVAHLADALRTDVILRIATLEEIPPGVMQEVSEVLEHQLSRLEGTGRKVRGAKLVADILNQLNPTVEQPLMTTLTERNPELAEQVRQLRFVFDDLGRVDDRAMQEILKEVNKEQLAVALKAAREDVKQKIFKNLSERAAQILQEDIETRGPVRLSEVEKSQQEILKVAMRLAEEGKITIGGRGGGDVLV